MKVYVVVYSDDDGNRYYVRVFKNKREADDMIEALDRLPNSYFVLEEEI